jgi:hypothetical protein
MRRLILAVLPLVLLLAIPSPAVAATTERFTLHLLNGDAFECSGAICTEYALRASRFTGLDARICLFLTTFEEGQPATSEGGCAFPSDDPLDVSGNLTITLSPTDIMLDSGRTVTVSATGTTIGSLPVTERLTREETDANGCTARIKSLERDSEFAHGALGTLTINDMTIDIDARLDITQIKVTTQC